MRYKFINPPNIGWLESKLEKSHMDFLWKIIEESEKKNISHKNKLVGHITNSLELNDKDDWFMRNCLIPNINSYVKSNHEKHPILQYSSIEGKAGITLGRFWVNYQHQTEFNPYHDHTGLYSFVIWMKIPYSHEDQKKVKLVKGMKEEDKRAGIFEIQYLNILGQTRNFPYHMKPELEGTMLLFPSSLRHCVYPFYECEEPRISISGNLYMDVLPEEKPIVTNIHNQQSDIIRNIVRGK